MEPTEDTFSPKDPYNPYRMMEAIGRAVVEQVVAQQGLADCPDLYPPKNPHLRDQLGARHTAHIADNSTMWQELRNQSDLAEQIRREVRMLQQAHMDYHDAVHQAAVQYKIAQDEASQATYQQAKTAYRSS